MYKLDEVKKQLAQSLEYATLNRCSRWAEKVRVMPPPFPGPWTFKYFPWLRQLHDDTSPEIFVKKASQMGYTEWAINKTLFFLDQKRANVMYILPSMRPDAVNFSKGRINRAAALSPYIDNMFAESKSETQKITSNHANLYLRGANATIKSLDCSLVILDEAAEISSQAIELARYRLAGQPEGTRQLLALSTPTVDGHGIDKLYQDTTQNHFMFRCPACSRITELSYPECLVITADNHTDLSISDSHYICRECKATLHQKDKPDFLAHGVWTPTKENMNAAGYFISQLYSCATTAVDLAKTALRAETDPIAKAEFYNSALGLCYVPENARLSDLQLNEAIGDHMNDSQNLINSCHRITIGIDIGQHYHHVIIIGWKLAPGTDILSSASGRILYFGKASSFKELEDIIYKWKPTMTVVDSQPYVKDSTALAKQFPQLCYACWYSQSKLSKQLITDENEGSVKVNRTFWMDQALGKFQGKLLTLPQDSNMELRNHLKSPVRVYKTDNSGITFCEFVGRDKDPDHYYHAVTYATIALGLTAGSGGVTEYYG